MLFAILYNALLLATCLCAARMGEWEERAGAAIVLVASLLTVFTAGQLETRFLSASLRLTLIDGSAWVLFVVVTVRSAKFWPLWASAMQFVAVLANFAPLLEIQRSLAYAIVEQMWAWLILAIILACTVRHRRRVRTI